MNMQSLKLDYRRKNPWPQRAGFAGLLLAALLAGFEGWQYRQLVNGIEAGRNALAELGGIRQASPLKAGTRQLDDEMGYARTVLMQLDVPWTGLFEAVETSVNPEVALLGIEPEPKRATVRILGEAKTYPAVLEYIRRLEASEPLHDVHLESHEIQTQDRERPVHFVLGATWRESP